MAIVISVTNQKGGVGKTTVSTNLAFALRALDKAVLLIDLDGQGQSSIYLSDDRTLITRVGGSERLFDGTAEKAILHTNSGIDLLHGHIELARIDTEGEALYPLDSLKELRAYITSLPYDFIIIDTPPALELRQLAAVLWADILIVVTTAEEKGLGGTFMVQKTIQGLQQRSLLPADYDWRILFNNVDMRISNQKQGVENMKRLMKNRVIPVALPSRPAIIEQSYATRIPIWQNKNVSSEFKSLWLSLPKEIGIL